MDAFSKQNGTSARDFNVAAIQKGAELQHALNPAADGPSKILAALISELVDDAEGAKDRALDLLKRGATELALGNPIDNSLLLLDYDLSKAIKATSLQHQMRNIFMLWPNLKSVTERFCDYVTPLLGGGTGTNTLLEESLLRAAKAYKAEPDEARKVQAYIFGLTDMANRLTNISIQGKFSRGTVTWRPFSQPITDWMRKYRLKTLKTTERSGFCQPETARVLLLAQIMTIEDIEIANMHFLSEGVA